MRLTSRHWGFRATGWLASYVLALQMLLSAFVPLAPLGAVPGGNLVTLICYGSGSADHADESGGAPRTIRDHCAACFVGSGALPPQPPVALPFAYPAPLASVARLADAPRLSAPDGKPGLPRAPPILA